MSIVLGGVTLSPDMVWLERYQSQGVAQSVRRTVGGVPVIFSGALVKAEPVTLATLDRMGYPTRAMIDQVIALAASAGATYTLSFYGEEISVMFRHDDPPVVDMQPVKRTNRPASTDWMRGQIKLLTI